MLIKIYIAVNILGKNNGLHYKLTRRIKKILFRKEQKRF